MKDNLQEQEHPQKEINFCENCDSIIHFSATFCDESCRLNYEENQSKPILQDNVIQPKEVDEYFKDKKEFDDIGWTGQYSLCNKDILDFIIDFKLKKI